VAPFPKKGAQVYEADGPHARERAHENSSRAQQAYALCSLFAEPSAVEAVLAYQGTAGIET
jgi:hypothetical protein